MDGRTDDDDDGKMRPTDPLIATTSTTRKQQQPSSPPSPPPSLTATDAWLQRYGHQAATTACHNSDHCGKSTH